MSLTNSQVVTRFLEGRTGNGNALFSREAMFDGMTGQPTAYQLVSYSLPIALRRNSDGHIFVSGQQYSPTTSQHQAIISYRYPDIYPFPALESLYEADWYLKCEVVEEHTPANCTMPMRLATRMQKQWVCLCPEQEYERREWIDGVYQKTGEIVKYPPHYRPGRNYYRCTTGHYKNVPYEYEQTTCPACLQWPAGWALLRFEDADVLVGGDYGRIRSRFNGTQLFAVKLVRRAESVVDALNSMLPEGCTHDTLRQGDLFFVPVELTKEQIKAMEKVGPGRFKLLSIPTERDTQTRHIAAHLYIDNDKRVLVRGIVEHPQHKRVSLKDQWHQVKQAVFADVATVGIRGSWWGGGAGWD